MTYLSKSLSKDASKYSLFTWSEQLCDERIVITRAKGSYFWDDKDKKYLDFVSQQVNLNLGHSHSKLTTSIVKQIKSLGYISPYFISKPKVELAKELVKLTGLGKVLFTTGGGEANENAIIIARQFSGKDVVLSRDPSYHGATCAARTASRDKTRNLPGKYDAPFFEYFSAPNCSKGNYKDHNQCCAASLNELKKQINKFNGNIAAIIIEPIPGAQGVLIPSKDYLTDLVSICRKNNILVIFDEVMTGFGRTGKWFSYQHWGVFPDIVTFSKGINGGAVPLGAVVISKKIARYFNHHKLLSGLTNSGHPLSCASAIEAIKIYKEEKLVQKAKKNGLLLKQLGDRFTKRYPQVSDFRSIGLFAALEFNNSGLISTTEEFVNQIYQETCSLGVYIQARLNCILIAPPLIIQPEEIRVGLITIDKAIKKCLEKYSKS